MTRRSFCFLFGAGVGAAALGLGPSLESLTYHTVDLHTRPSVRYIRLTLELLEDSKVNMERYMSNALMIDGKLHTVTGEWIE